MSRRHSWDVSQACTHGGVAWLVSHLTWGMAGGPPLCSTQCSVLLWSYLAHNFHAVNSSAVAIALDVFQVMHLVSESYSLYRIYYHSSAHRDPGTFSPHTPHHHHRSLSWGGGGWCTFLPDTQGMSRLTWVTSCHIRYPHVGSHLQLI